MLSEIWGLIVYAILLLGFLIAPVVLSYLGETLIYSLRCAFGEVKDRWIRFIDRLLKKHS